MLRSCRTVGEPPTDSVGPSAAGRIVFNSDDGLVSTGDVTVSPPSTNGTTPVE
ncbi:hypothetical protein BH11MYX2_BH11MYX2_28320 [soil metagenome]